ncbi:uncharacterized protein C2845_PM06G09570 [Panicum miliaceum]|uniref:Uncharacterized protein n=1 Tax=Panicum miliaceum TaxID=4540 RepID=A0A3L6R5Y8_PANMI|nr:uncharacterized protein C2845_PM06G09570 [Panicum miliaceum]
MGAPPPLAVSPAHTRGALLASWQEKGGALISSYQLLPSSPTNDRTIKHLGLSFYLTEPYLQSIGRAVANVTESFCLVLSRHPCERGRSEDGANKVNVSWDQASPDLKHHRLSPYYIS